MIPPRSPYSLIQEDLWPDKWLVLVSCMMLNCTTRKQVEKVLPDFVNTWPTASDFMSASDEDVVSLIRPLGFANRRTKNLKRMTEHFVAGPWEDPRELPGVGEYAARAYEIFCMGIIGDEPPVDHALVQYWRWRVSDGSAIVLHKAVDDVELDEEPDLGSLDDPRRDPQELTVGVEGTAA